MVPSLRSLRGFEGWLALNCPYYFKTNSVFWYWTTGTGDILPFHYDRFLKSIFSDSPLMGEQDRTSEVLNLNPKESTIGRNDSKQEIQAGR